MRKYREYTDEDVVNLAKESFSIAELLRKLDLKEAGGNYANMHKTLQRLSVDCSHWTGQSWNKDKQLKDWSEYSKAPRLKKHLITERGHRCESCNLTEWLSKPIPLELHHVDGDRTNNSKENLKLLCCNCHANTDSWRKWSRSRESNPHTLSDTSS